MTHEEYYAPPPKNKQLSPHEIVARDRATKYSDEEIRNAIEWADADIDIDEERFWAPSTAYSQIAQAMIAYNRMIDERTWAAERSWKGK